MKSLLLNVSGMGWGMNSFVILVVLVLLVPRIAFGYTYYDGNLIIDVNYSLSDSLATPLLCLGVSSDNQRCYALNTIPQTYTHPGAATAQSDHPFVNHPDDWDDMWLVNNSGSDVMNVTSVRVTLEVQIFNGPPGFESYTFVDKPGLNLGIPPNSRFSMRSWVRERRECVFRNAYCGSTDPDWCDPNPNATCDFAPEAMIADVDVSNLPWSLKEALNDIGQPGMTKFAPVDTSRRRNGCYGPPGFYLGQYSGNIDANCNENTTVCTNNSDDDIIGHDWSEYCPFTKSNRIPNCTYFRYFASPATRNEQSLIWIDQFIAAGRAARVLFDEDATGTRAIIPGGHTDGYVICRLDSNGFPRATQVTVSGGSSWRCSDPYEPKSGDYYQNQHHVMVWLGAPPIVDAGGGNFDFGGAILQKGNPLQVLRRMDPIADPIETHDFWFGETDQTNAPMRMTQQVTLLGTVL